MICRFFQVFLFSFFLGSVAFSQNQQGQNSISSPPTLPQGQNQPGVKANTPGAQQPQDNSSAQTKSNNLQNNVTATEKNPSSPGGAEMASKNLKTSNSSPNGQTTAPTPATNKASVPSPSNAGSTAPATTIPPPQVNNPPPEATVQENNNTNDPNLGAGANPSFSNDPAFMESEILSYLEPYIYDVEGRRDPFQPYQVFKSTVADDSVTNIKPVTSPIPLQRYNLSQLKLKAILWNVKNPRIIVQDPTSVLHTLVTNDRIGNNGGYVAKIREGEVVVLEKVNIQGRMVSSTKLLRLKR